MRIAIVGCGFVADFYAQTLPNHPELELRAVYDRDVARAGAFSQYHGVPACDSLEQLLADERVELVLNLTNPSSHFEVSKACLEAGKHVYSEKPLSLDLGQAEELVQLAESRGRGLSSAPCNVLSESAQTVWKALREQRIGTPRLVYAELDDGLIHRMRYRQWRSDSGAPWPWKDEFEVGCTLEHAGYYVTWLAAFFGPARTVTSFASCQVPDKETDQPLDRQSPDFTVGCITFRNGVVARVTCSIIASHNHRLQVFGDEGILSVEECWDYRCPVYLKRRTRWALRLEKWPWISRLLGFEGRRCPQVRRPQDRYGYRGTHRMDFARGVADLAAAVQRGRPCTLHARFALHVNEIVLALQEPERMGCPRALTTTFEPLSPPEWAV